MWARVETDFGQASLAQRGGSHSDTFSRRLWEKPSIYLRDEQALQPKELKLQGPRQGKL